MEESLLSHKHTGPLTVVTNTLEGEVHRFTLDFKDTTLFQYIGEACARIFTNLTTRLIIRTCPDDWMIIDFSPEEGKLEALQVGGEPLIIEDDDPKRLAHLYSSSDW